MDALPNCPVLSLIFSNLVLLILQLSECNETCKDWIVTCAQKCIAAFHPQPCKATILLNDDIYQEFIYIYIKYGTKLIFVLGTKTSPVLKKSAPLHGNLESIWWVHCWHFRKQGRVLWLPITRLHFTPSSARAKPIIKKMKTVTQQKLSTTGKPCGDVFWGGLWVLWVIGVNCLIYIWGI